MITGVGLLFVCAVSSWSDDTSWCPVRNLFEAVRSFPLEVVATFSFEFVEQTGGG